LKICFNFDFDLIFEIGGSWTKTKTASPGYIEEVENLIYSNHEELKENVCLFVLFIYVVMFC